MCAFNPSKTEKKPLFISTLFIHKACNHSFKWLQFEEIQAFLLPYWSYLKAWSDNVPCLVYSLWSDIKLWSLIISWHSMPSSFWNIFLSFRILPHSTQAPSCHSSLFSHFYCHLLVLSVKVQLKSKWIDSLTTGPKIPVWPWKKAGNGKRKIVDKWNKRPQQAGQKQARSNLASTVHHLHYVWMARWKLISYWIIPSPQLLMRQ